MDVLTNDNDNKKELTIAEEEFGSSFWDKLDDHHKEKQPKELNSNDSDDDNWELTKKDLSQLL